MRKNGKRISPCGTVLNAPSGKYKVVGVDKFSNEDWEHGIYENENEAVKEAVKMTKAESKLSSDTSIETVYYAYDDQGNYLGGDIYEKSLDEMLDGFGKAMKFERSEFIKHRENFRKELKGGKH